jgi:hypothetical protein
MIYEQTLMYYKQTLKGVPYFVFYYILLAKKMLGVGALVPPYPSTHLDTYPIRHY